MGRRRAFALGTSALVHAAALAVLAPRATPGAVRGAPAIAIEEVSAAEVSPDLLLPPPAPASADDTFASSSRRDDEFAFDSAKIRARENALFPFLTLDLQFLDRITRDMEAALQRVTNPLAAARQEGTASPLELSDEAIQRVTDGAWSRRNRWKTFAEIARLLASHHSTRGAAPRLVRQYLDQNILQPHCDGHRHDPRFWAMLENAADHADFIDFVCSYARRYPSSKTTTELLFLLDELAQGSRDVMLMVIETRPERDLSYTRTMTPDAFQLAVAIKERYGRWLFDRHMEKGDVRRHYGELRLRLLQTIVSTTPDGYRAADAQCLRGRRQTGAIRCRSGTKKRDCLRAPARLRG